MTTHSAATRPSLMATCAAATTQQTRILFGMAGSLTLIGVLLGAYTYTWFLVLPVLVGANQILMATKGWCPMSLLLTRLGIGTRTTAH
jgi:hypothetical protein